MMQVRHVGIRGKGRSFVLAFMVVLFGLLWYDYQRTLKPFTILFNDVPFAVATHQKTVEGALLDVGLRIHPNDIIEPDPSSDLVRDEVVRVKSARQVSIDADGRLIECYTHRRTPGEILKEAGIDTTDHDKVVVNGREMPLYAPLTEPEPGRQAGRSLLGGPKPPWEDPVPPVRLVLKRAATIYVNDGGIPAVLHTTATTVGEALRLHDIVLYLGDRINPALGTRVSTGLRVYIQRSKAVEIIADGHSLRTRTRGETVADVLAQQGVALVGNDMVAPPEPTAVQEGMGIRVTRVSRARLIEQDTIPFETVWRPHTDLEIDQQELEREGREGVTKRRIDVIYHDGQEVQRELEDEWLESEPETKVIRYGTRIIPRTLQVEGNTLTYWRKIRMLATSYSAATSGKDADHPRYGITFTGVPVTKGIVAVDPKVIGLHSDVYIPGYGRATAGDTGGAITGRRIDLGYGDDELVMWYRWVDVFLLGPPPPQDQIRWVLPNWPRERR